MRMSSDDTPDPSLYIRLMDDFIADRMSAPEFQKAYLSTLQEEQRIFGDDVFSAIQKLFEDVDAYVAYPELRTEPEDLDEEQLRKCALRARRELRDLGFD